MKRQKREHAYLERERWHIGLKAWLWPFWLSRRRVGSPQLEAQENQAETLLTRLITALPEGEAKLKAALEDVKGVITTQQKARAKAEARAEKLRGLMLQFLDRHAQASSWRPRRFNRLIISIAAALGCTMALNVYFILTVSEPWIAAQAVWRAASERVASGLALSKTVSSYQELPLPPAKPAIHIVAIHVVKAGDTPMRIAKHFNTSSHDLTVVNTSLRGVPPDALLRPGVLLNIPGKVK